MMSTVEEDYADELAERPWLCPFIEDGDRDLEPAERRYRLCIVEARAHLRSQGVGLHYCIRPGRDIQTTALEMDTRRRDVSTATAPGRAVTLEDGGRILRGLALPFDAQALVLDHRKGDPVIEVMDQDSFDAPPGGPVPLLEGHRRDSAPAGVVQTAHLQSYGVPVEAEILVGADALDGWHRRFKAGVGTGLSVGFTQDPRRAKWERPTRPGQPPIVRPRGVTIVEVSLVTFPAYHGARVSSLSLRTAKDQRSHAESERIINDWECERIEREAKRRAGKG